MAQVGFAGASKCQAQVVLELKRDFNFPPPLGQEAGEIEALFEEAARERSGLPLEKALQAMERAGKMEIELPLVPLQESFWKVIGQKDFPAGPELSVLAARLGFSGHC